ncbi:MAG: helix-turn-helix domain-containing protein [Planctomycetaceae bacterium]|nr:helix-turn-helix domain-containing protein [Planctomycetaceae bacterium]
MKYLTPPQYAAMLGCKPSKVIQWIEAGELRAVNQSDGPRPRWKIPPDAITEFENKRGPKLSVPSAPKRQAQRRPVKNVIEYY